MRDDPLSSASHPNRRTFLRTTGETAAATVLAGCPPADANPPAGPNTSPPDGLNIPGAIPVTLRINGKENRLRIDPRTTLLDCLRETVALTGTKKGCDHGQCGACTVHVNGRRVISCLSLAALHEGQEITTIEGLGLAQGTLRSQRCGRQGIDERQHLPVRRLRQHRGRHPTGAQEPLIEAERSP
jgi:xanthine dehydrogenase YagT iron-sulfur-binding subunit